FLRELRRRCIDPRIPEMVNSDLWALYGNDIERAQSIGYASRVFLRGFSWPEDGVADEGDRVSAKKCRSFPSPWQNLAKRERARRSHIDSDRTSNSLTPFSRGYSCFAQWIAEYCDSVRKRAFERQEAVKAMNAEVSQRVLWGRRLLKSPTVRPSLFSASAEVGVFSIQWGTFTNEELRDGFYRWARKNRPKDLPAPDGRGHKLGDWRAKLTRLAVMRLLSSHTAAQILDGDLPELKEVREAPQFGGSKWVDEEHWRRARREALKDFHALLPFLDKDEKPLSWQRKKTDK